MDTPTGRGKILYAIHYFNDTHSCHPTANTLSSALNSTSITTNAPHTCHSTTNTLSTGLSSMRLTTNDNRNCHYTVTNLSSNMNSTSVTTNDTHNCHPTATNQSLKLNSTPRTDHETHNSHPTAISTMDIALYSTNTLSTPTSDREAVPDLAGSTCSCRERLTAMEPSALP